MKKLTACVVSVALAISLSACGMMDLVEKLPRPTDVLHYTRETPTPAPRNHDSDRPESTPELEASQGDVGDSTSLQVFETAPQEETDQKERDRHREEYLDNLYSVYVTMSDGAGTADDVCAQTFNVWNHSIWRTEDADTDMFTRQDGGTGAFYDDFNTALGNLYRDPDYQRLLGDVSEAQAEVLRLMRLLKDPPEEFKDEYRLVKDCYEAFFDYTDLALYFKGSLNSFSEEYPAARDRFMKCWRELTINLG